MNTKDDREGPRRFPLDFTPEQVAPPQEFLDLLARLEAAEAAEKAARRPKPPSGQID
jgi:hypothetical protein